MWLWRPRVGPFVHVPSRRRSQSLGAALLSLGLVLFFLAAWAYSLTGH